ncbi:hypothetical protein F5144DRAFT_570304 [Chaetomium tenue]|uniref:Uncharacterized protein n=1 Tax=Chaetomium tenue TaxID=1854479 RepID=A0ACB7PES6_9PEZI|nr:hypothetical protein F5144DRAFT_570304 [Chaetomium globosum]
MAYFVLKFAILLRTLYVWFIRYLQVSSVFARLLLREPPCSIAARSLLKHGRYSMNMIQSVLFCQIFYFFWLTGL